MMLMSSANDTMARQDVDDARYFDIDMSDGVQRRDNATPNRARVERQRKTMARAALRCLRAAKIVPQNRARKDMRCARAMHAHATSTQPRGDAREKDAPSRDDDAAQTMRLITMRKDARYFAAQTMRDDDDAPSSARPSDRAMFNARAKKAQKDDA